eukprot:10712233-Ditylum_brightwellii.AAC.1
MGGFDKGEQHRALSSTLCVCLTLSRTPPSTKVGMEFCSIDLHPFFIVPSASQLHPPPHGPVTGCTTTDSTFNCPRPGSKPVISDFQDCTKHA